MDNMVGKSWGQKAAFNPNRNMSGIVCICLGRIAAIWKDVYRIGKN
jgi:hypothetical protein